MRRDWENFSIRPLEAEREWTVEGLPVLRAAASLPEPETAGRIRRFYRTQQRAFFTFCRRELLPWAEAEGRDALANGRPPACCQADLTFRETYRNGRLWSLYTQIRENAAPGPATLLRWGDAWDLAEDFPVPASALFPKGDPWRRRLLASAAGELERRERAGRARYRPGWRRALRRYFSPRRYFLTPEGPVFFYPMYALGPASEGIPEFLLPWDGDPPAAPVR